MTVDWKGTPVHIEIWKDWTTLVYSIDTRLDTDTLLDLFSIYDPATHSYAIDAAYDEEEDLD